MTENAFFVFATFVDISAAIWIFGALFTDRLQRMPRWHIAGMACGGLGLMAQAMRNMYFLWTGDSATDADLPLWFLKDFGYWLIAAPSIYLVITKQLELNDPMPEKKLVKKTPAKPRAKKQTA